MRYLLLAILLLPMSICAEQEVTPAELQKEGQRIFKALDSKASYLTARERTDVMWELKFIDRILALYPDYNPFKLRLSGNTLKVYSGDKLIISWHKHNTYEIKGNVIALLDSGGEFVFCFLILNDGKYSAFSVFEIIAHGSFVHSFDV